MLAIYALFTSFFDLFIVSPAHYLGHNTAILTGIHSSTELVLIVLYFSAQGQYHKYRKRYMVAAIVSILFVGYELIAHPLEFPSISRSLQSVLIIVISLWHGYRWIVQWFARFYEILVIFSFLVYHLLNITAFLFANAQMTAASFWTIHDVLGIITNLLLFAALSIYLKQNVSHTTGTFGSNNSTS